MFQIENSRGLVFAVDAPSDVNRSLRAGLAPEHLRYPIEHAVAHVFAIPQPELGIVTRGSARVAQARQISMYLAHVVCRLSFTEVGQLFDRDRTTVAHACMVIEDRRDDPVFDHILALLERIVPALMRPSSPLC